MEYAPQDILHDLKEIIVSNAAEYATVSQRGLECFDALKAELRELEKELGKCNALVEGLQEKVNRAQNAAENAKEDLDELKADLEEKQESIQKFRKREVSVAF